AALDVPRFLTAARQIYAGITSGSNDTAAAGDIAKGIINGNLGSVVVNGSDSFNLNATFEYAQAISELFGLQADAGFQRRVFGVTLSYPTGPDARQSATRYDALLGASLEFDANKLHVPIAAMIEYEADIRLGGTGDENLEQDNTVTHRFGAGLYYSGQRNLQVGVAGALIRNLRPIAGLADAPGQSGT